MGNGGGAVESEYCEPLEELRALAENCVRGVPTGPVGDGGGQAPSRLRLDRWSPHALVDAFIEKHHLGYKLGRCQDASGALSDVIGDTPSLHRLFHFVSSNGEEEVVMRLPFFRGRGRRG